MSKENTKVSQARAYLLSLIVHIIGKICFHATIAALKALVTIILPNTTTKMHCVPSFKVPIIVFFYMSKNKYARICKLLLLV